MFWRFVRFQQFYTAMLKLKTTFEIYLIFYYRLPSQNIETTAESSLKLPCGRLCKILEIAYTKLIGKAQMAFPSFLMFLLILGE
jgi:hypothetical protein